MTKIRFGITGSGLMGRTHAEAIKRLDPTATLVAIAGGSRAPGLAAQYGVACEKNAEALAARKDIDAIVISTPQSEHFRETMAALESGKHVMIEKPMATTLEHCDRMLEVADRRRLVIAISYTLRFFNNPPRARELIIGNAIGPVVAMHHTNYMDAEVFKSGNFPRNWYHRPENVGIVIDGLTHGIDTLRWLTGSEVKTVAGFARAVLPEGKNKDTAAALIEFSSGAVCSVTLSIAVPGRYPRYGARYSLIGTNGLIDMDAFGDLHISNRKEGWRLVTSQPPILASNPDSVFGDVRMKAFCDQLQSFIDGIHGKTMIAANGADGREGLAACVAILAASAENRLAQPD